MLPKNALAAHGDKLHELVPTGVTLERSWQTSHDDEVAAMSDRWSSSDGAVHTLDALYAQEGNDNSGAAYEFPGTSAFAATSNGQTVTLPSGSGSILIKSHAAHSRPGRRFDPQGAIV